MCLDLVTKYWLFAQTFLQWITIKSVFTIGLLLQRLMVVSQFGTCGHGELVHVSQVNSSAPQLLPQSFAPWPHLVSQWDEEGAHLKYLLHNLVLITGVACNSRCDVSYPFQVRCPVHRHCVAVIAVSHLEFHSHVICIC